MKLTKKLEAEIKALMDDYWASYLKGNIRHWKKYLVDDYRNIGGTEEEIWNSKKEILDYTNRMIVQMKGLTELRNKQIQIIPYDPYFMVHELLDVYIKVDEQWTFYQKFRLSSLIQKIDEEWKVLHQHGSYPDSKTQEGEAFAVDEIKVENKKLKDAIKRRTIQLEEKNRELEIETALEKVRARSMAMHKTSELQTVIHTVHKELLNLNIAIDGGSFIAINSDIESELRCWGSGGTANTTEEVHIPLYKKPFCTNLINRIKKGPGFFTEEYSPKEKKDFFTFLFKHQPWSKLNAKQKKETLSSPGGYTRSCCVSKHTSIFIINHHGEIFSADDNEILKRFAKVFEQTYTRFLDLQKAEAQAKEAKIELALERVRARTMAMQRSEELLEVADVLFQQLRSFGGDLWGAGIGICQPESDNDDFYFANENGIFPRVTIPHTKDPTHKRLYKGWKNKEVLVKETKDGIKLKAHYDYLNSVPSVNGFFQGILDAGLTFPTWQRWHAAYFSHGYIMLITTSPYAEEQLLVRFAKVFDQAYIRFLDLQKAEAQAREAMIEVSLERVRSRAMAMHKTDELLDAGELVYKELTVLGITSMAVSYAFVNEQKKNALYYGINPLDGKIPPVPFVFPHTETEEMRSVLKSWKKMEAFKMIELDEEATLKHQTWVGAHMQTILAKNNISFSVDEFLAVSPQTAVIYTFHFKQGYIFIIGEERLSAMQEEIVLRFTKVFEMTYRRFLDLQKAESQARESQIEAALEKVRSRSLAMHKTDELQEVVSVVLERMTDLNIELDTININIFKEHSYELNLWTAAPGQKYAVPFHLPFFDHPFHTDIFTAKENGLDFFTKTYSLDEKNSYFNYTFEHSDFKYVPEAKKKLIMEGRACTRSMAITKNAGIIIIRYYEKLFSDSENEILKRFAKVFEQAYTRFLDLQKAEAQARESQIEAALEKIRSRSLAMHRSDELKDVIAIMFEKLNELNVLIGTVGIWLFNKAKMDSVFWVGNDLQQPSMVSLPYDARLMEEDTNYRDSWQAWISGENYINKRYTAEQKNKYFNYVFANNNVEVIPAPVREIIMKAQVHIASLIVEKNSSLFFDSWQDQSYSEASIDVFKKVSKVFEQAYVRFLDLQKAEAQAKESHIQLALERVRARTMSMQKSDELADAAQLLYHEFATLGINTFSCGYMFIDEESKTQTGWFVLPDGVLVPNFVVFPLTGDHVLDKRYKDWQEKIPLHIYEIDGEVNKEHHRFLADHVPSFMVKDMFSKMPERIVFHCANFSVGYLLILATDLLTPQEQQTLIRFAKVFEMTYRRFLDLKKAEAQAREAMIEAALERVRSRSMAMHKSDEVMDVAVTLYDQLQKLDFKFGAATIIIMDKKTGYMEHWLAGFIQQNHIESYEVTNIEHPLHAAQLAAWREGAKFVSIEMSGDDLKSYAEEIFTKTGYKNLPDEEKRMLLAREHSVFNLAYMSHGALMWAPSALTDENANILQRFAKVFEQTYTRFLDMQKAESQAREAQIELGLERVRAKAMAMQSSSELAELVDTLFKELTKLDILLDRCIIMLYDAATNDSTWWIAAPESEALPISVVVKFHNYAPYLAYIDAWQKRILKWRYELEGTTKKEWDNFIFSETEMAMLPTAVKDGMKSFDKIFLNVSFNNFGSLTASSSETLPEEQFEILLRFAKVFDSTYTRFNDLQKAEAQARESQIQLALERVRARTMAMQHSDELAETASLLFKQISDLGMETWTSGFNIWEKDDTSFMSYSPSPEGGITTPYSIPSTVDGFFKKIYKAKKRGEEFLVFESSGTSLANTYKYMKTLPVVKDVLKGIEDAGFQLPAFQINHCTFFAQGFLLFITLKSYPEAHDIFVRFAKVFEQTYTRFLDLQKAEAQAREALIEAALEKVRSRSMGMQKSEELKEVIKVVYEQFVHLNINVEHTGFIMDYKERDDMHIWLADQHLVPSEVFIPYFDSAHWNSFREAKEKGTDFFPTLLDFEEKNKFYKDLFELIPGIPEETMDYYFSCPGLAGSTVLLDNVSLYVENFQGIPYSDEENKILMRFGKVFQQTYTRFLDLQKAEAQAREAQIEAALERTRTQSMIMQHSNELDDTLRVFHEQVLLLGIHSAFSFLWLPDEEKSNHIFWAAWEEHKNDSTAFKSKAISYPLDRNEPATAQCLVDWRSDEPVHSYAVKPAEVDNYFAAWAELLDGVEKLKPKFFRDGLYYVEAFMKYGCFGVMLENDLSEEEKNILYRFSVEFERTYTRFLDLQKAEAQAREAKIEMALEKIRSRTMAMQHSDELPEAANLLFLEVQALGIPAWSAGYNILADDKKSSTCIMSSEGQVQSAFHLPFTNSGESSYEEWLEAIEKQESFFVQELSGKKIQDHYNYMKTLPQVGPVIKELEDAGLSLPTYQINHLSFFNGGFLLFITYEPVPDAHDIFRRFTKVFEQTYTRFLDLQKAEAQAREAQIETGLEKVRSRTLAMQKSDELADTSIVIFEQLISLGIEPNRLFIGIINKETAAIEAWATNEDGTKIGNHFTLNTDRNKSVKKMFDGWKHKKSSITIDMQGEELQKYFHYLADEMKIPFKGGLSQKRRIQTIAYFGQGLIGMASPDEQPAATAQLLERFAAVFNLTYTRFNDLKIAEAHAIQAEEDLVKLQTEKRRAEEALTNLQAAQKQLVQSEKMASLGELTAGIAHEIQNPLNFVNNFSEVSKELLDEMKEEMEKGHLEDVKQILQDVIQNLEKINLHGKRADGIVKGMLQHSQSSKGQKQPTDINALCDEYLRLSYHGLRAKDKSFNAEFKTDFDKSIGKINIIPQDIGRVLLNLYNNAFYAVNEKGTNSLLKTHNSQFTTNYQPTVSVTTKKSEDHVTITVSDNGNGIPQNIVDKIFQPFFTTKPTGQGTGLGLSLSYDIVKAHGGEIKVETKANDGTTFIIHLPASI